MNQPIAGVSPSELEETTIMTVFPSISAYPTGRLLGQLYNIEWPNIYIFKLGNLIALLSIPHALGLYFFRIAPVVGTRYRLTNRRIVEQYGIMAVDDRSVDLDRFDSIEVVVLPGQEWYNAGDLVFRKGDIETFRLAGVSRPETFRQTCIKAQMAHAGVKAAQERELAHA